MKKPILIIQLRPEDDTSDNEYQAILNYGELSEEQTKRLRIEKMAFQMVYQYMITAPSSLVAARLISAHQMNKNQLSNIK